MRRIRFQSGKDTPLPARPPLRTVRASFPVSSSSPREAACNCAAGSLSFKRTYASITVVVSRKSAEVADTVSGAISCAPSMNSDYDSASEDRAEVCSASREVMLQPLSAPLQYSLRFSTFSYLHGRQRPLRFACHEGSRTGLPRSHSVTRPVQGSPFRRWTFRQRALI